MPRFPARLQTAAFLFLLFSLASAALPCASSGSLLADPSLERSIMGMDKRYAHLKDEYNVYERLIHDRMTAIRVEELEVQYKEIAFMLRVSAGQPFSYRHLYNEMFDLYRNVAGLLGEVDSVIESASTNINIIEESLDEYGDLPLGRLSPKALRAVENLGAHFAGLQEKMREWVALLMPYRDRLRDLSDKIDATLEELQDEIPEWLVYFMFTTDNHLFQSQPWLLLPAAWHAWYDSLGYSLAAKLPDSWPRLRRFLIVFAVSGLFIFIPGRWLWSRWFAPPLRGRPEALRNMAVGFSCLGMAVAIFIASTELMFPGRMFLQAIQNLGLAYGVYRLAWGLRGLYENISPRPLLRPLFILYILDQLLHFLGVPLVLALALWPLLLVFAVWACLRSLRHCALVLERRVLAGSVLLYGAGVVMSAGGLVFISLFLGLAWFVAAMALQLGVALSRLIKEGLVARYASSSRFSLSILAGLTIPVLWMLLAVGFVFWGVEQFGEIRLLARFVKIDKAAAIMLTLLVVLFLDRLLASLLAFYGTYPASRKRPIKGYVQLGRLFVFILGAIVLGCLFMDKSPWGILGGIGAMTAVLMFVFKDTIQALVASVQIVADDLVRIGDWIEIEKQGVDGDVVDVTLHTIKVRNWDMTISSVSTYSLIIGSFKNWRGMVEANGRRVKRKLLLDQASIRFLDRQAMDRLSKVEALAEYFSREAAPEPPGTPEQAMLDPEALNSSQLTNAGAYRAYMKAWLRNHPLVRQDMTFLLRYLNPTIDGLPFEIYLFASDTHWPTYESIQADILDHAEASLSLFGLRISQRPAPRHTPSPALAAE